MAIASSLSCRPGSIYRLPPRRVLVAVLLLLTACEGGALRRSAAEDGRGVQLDDGASQRDGARRRHDGSAPSADTSRSTHDTLPAGADASTATGPRCDTTLHRGEGTYYAADGTGNCSFDKTTDIHVAAMNQIDYAGAAVCGACIHATGPSGSVTVRIVDRCPECKVGDVDFSKGAFSKIAAVSAGRVKISWRYVPCSVSGPIRYYFKSGSNPWWTAVQVRDHRHRIKTFEIKKSGAWVKVSRVDYNFFVDSSGMGPGPYAFRVTDVYGQQLVDTGIALKVGASVSGAKQFPRCR